MVSEDRQRVIETNRSLRLIKNELESLLEKGVISDETFESITALLPAESSLASSSGARNAPAVPTPAATTPNPSSSPAPAPASSTPNPPSYAQSTATPPALPIRTNSNNTAPPPPPPTKPVLARARALYRYAASDARDVSFERDDRIAVHEYMNADWWMGRNERTGAEGIFPRSYVVVLQEDDDNGGKMAYYQQPQPYAQYPAQAGGGGAGGYPAAPPAGTGFVPYDQQQLQQQQHGSDSGGGKFGEQGKKFGKKLGNAAIFGAGATIGSNIVNSIF
ncbi:hypothetical protein VTK56DRAFT_2627 [Thermocarpiscus australiensis]